jgi:hypothetical protein
MNPLFAAAGLAEAAWAFALIICWADLLVIITLTVSSYALRSAKVAMCATILFVLSSLFFQPWLPFIPIDDPEVAADSDVIAWNSAFSFMAIAWGLEAAAILAYFPTAPLREKRRARMTQMKADALQERISVFWAWFVAKEHDLRSATGDTDSLGDAVICGLHKIDEHLYFEVCVNATPCEFIITVEGRNELFPVVDAAIEAAPAIPGWTFIALKPPMGFDFTTTYEGITFDPKTMWFLPLKSTFDPKRLGLRVGVPEFSSAIERPAANAVLVILDTALGERSASLNLGLVEVVALPTNPKAEGYILLTGLPTYIQEWNQK